jgi:phosphoglucosamine mutase
MVSSPVRPDSAAAVAAAVPSSAPSAPKGTGWAPLPLPQSALFGTDGIRGHVGELLSAPLSLQIGYWAGQVLQAQARMPGPVIVGQDSRNSSPMLAAALSAGLSAAGLEVWHLGLCPTAAVAYLSGTCQAVGGVMISASHNPPGDNGIKFFAPNGTKLPTQQQQQIEAALRQGHGPISGATWGTYQSRPDLLRRYHHFLQSSLPKVSLSGLKIVLDMAWGSAAGIAQAAFEQTGATVIGLHGQPDGNQINVGCGSTHLGPLKAAVAAHQAHIGFAFDGDADRVLAVDAQGRVVDGDYILYLWGKTLHQRQQLPDNTIVSTVMANLGFERAWQALGGTLIRTAVGDQYVHAEMLQRGAKLGGEQSGHILCHHYSMTGDGILTALHLASLVQQTGGCLSTLMDHSFTPYPQRLENVRVLDRDVRLNWQNCDPLQQAIATAEAAMGSDGRVLVRASGTEPLIRVMVEAASAELVNHWTDSLAAVVNRHLVAA